MEKDPSADPPVVGKVLVTIHKQDPDAGLVTWVATHFEGDLLGRPAHATSTRHRVFSPVKKQEVVVDFDTGLILREVNPRTVVGEHTPLGFRTFVADQIIVGKPDGSWDWLHLDPTDSSSGLTAAPRKYSYSKHDVAWFLYQADDSWLSKNPKVKRQAQERYRTLLRDFSEDQLVKAHLERIKERATAEVED